MVFSVDATLLLWGKTAKNLTKTFLFTAMSRTRESTKQAYIEKHHLGIIELEWWKKTSNPQTLSFVLVILRMRKPSPREARWPRKACIEPPAASTVNPGLSCPSGLTHWQPFSHPFCDWQSEPFCFLSFSLFFFFLFTKVFICMLLERIFWFVYLSFSYAYFFKK